MKKIKEMLQMGKLTEAIQWLESELKEDPLNIDFRSTLIELLCVKGELDRADKQLNIMVQKHPEFLIGATNLRQLIRAEQARKDFSNGISVPELFSGTNEHSEALIQLNVELHNGDRDSIRASAENLEKIRPALTMKLDNSAVTELRDLDDTLGGFVEIFGTDGKFYLAELSEIEVISFKPPVSIIEQVWRRVDLSIKEGPSGEAHVPLVYVQSETDAEKLGRETDWKEISTDMMVGKGQKMWLVDDSAVTFSEFKRLTSDNY
ncbi:type VI secretion system accessory protein TagJ [Psychromonas antarctica]|uniref:type VI secretion system accessory protein TagJ n=1 Tax=Psychromonas antarctica TaxID=67573 RepID=UPI001EE78807|nr:type VI secretion system accessory protein TagJ [Psychromonas antarctica]MCG6202374.1 virulence protein, SciE type [Psychromonas antarctica]